MGEMAYVKMPNGRVHRFDMGKRTVSGVVRADEQSEMATAGDWSGLVDELCTGEPYRHLRDLSYRSLGDGVMAFEAGLATDPGAWQGVSWASAEDFVASLSEAFGLLPCESQHALDNMRNEYPNETVTQLVGGREVHCPAHPEVCDYVRVCFAGLELAYWVCDEWEMDPTGVMGALMASMRGSRRP
jgi:hypothetical protein